MNGFFTKINTPVAINNHGNKLLFFFVNASIPFCSGSAIPPPPKPPPPKIGFGRGVESELPFVELTSMRDADVKICNVGWVSCIGKPVTVDAVIGFVVAVVIGELIGLLVVEVGAASAPVGVGVAVVEPKFGEVIAPVEIGFVVDGPMLLDKALAVGPIGVNGKDELTTFFEICVSPIALKYKCIGPCIDPCKSWLGLKRFVLMLL